MPLIPLACGSCGALYQSKTGPDCVPKKTKNDIPNQSLRKNVITARLSRKRVLLPRARGLSQERSGKEEWTGWVEKRGHRALGGKKRLEMSGKAWETESLLVAGDGKARKARFVLGGGLLRLKPYTCRGQEREASEKPLG